MTAVRPAAVVCAFILRIAILATGLAGLAQLIFGDPFLWGLLFFPVGLVYAIYCAHKEAKRGSNDTD